MTIKKLRNFMLIKKKLKRGMVDFLVPLIPIFIQLNLTFSIEFDSVHHEARNLFSEVIILQGQVTSDKKIGIFMHFGS